MLGMFSVWKLPKDQAQGERASLSAACLTSSKSELAPPTDCIGPAHQEAADPCSGWDVSEPSVDYSTVAQQSAGIQTEHLETRSLTPAKYRLVFGNDTSWRGPRIHKRTEALKKSAFLSGL